MTSFYEILDKVEERPGIYLGKLSIYCLRAFLFGYGQARYEMGIEESEEEKDFRNFKDWLQKETGIYSQFSWPHILTFIAGNEEIAVERFFDYFQDFKSKKNPPEEAKDDLFVSVGSRHVIELYNLHISILSIAQDEAQIESLSKEFSGQLDVPDILTRFISTYTLYSLVIINFLKSSDSDFFSKHISLLASLNTELSQFINQGYLSINSTDNQYWHHPEWSSIRALAKQILKFFGDSNLDLSRCIQTYLVH